MARGFRQSFRDNYARDYHQIYQPGGISGFSPFQAIEGYVDLGMFEEAEEELRELDPLWFAFEQTLKLRSRVYAGRSN